MEVEEPSRRGCMRYRISTSFSGSLGGCSDISQGPRSRLEEESVEEKESHETEVAGSLKDAPEAFEASNEALSNQLPISQVEPNFLKMIEQMTQLMGQLTQAVLPMDNSRTKALKTPSMKEPDFFDGNQAHKLRGLIQSCKFIFHNDSEKLLL
ncbi:hypothetical protein O181_089540 [Austropuccinia psidii MF-1]|uniref:Uncharacterized protein n=1 Tax=Austropuccinia psidii MF-1 TaxID=1389203 RepID=A0A9Q3ITG6_9BASI|nr:hypothetical protein [Austropuccinia psidii MF-1]